MIHWPGTILVATAPIHLRLSFDRLASIVREQLGTDPRSDTLIVFHNRARTHVKLLWHDGGGYCLFYKRLDRGTYRIPLAIPPEAQQVSVSARELAPKYWAQTIAGLDARYRAILRHPWETGDVATELAAAIARAA